MAAAYASSDISHLAGSAFNTKQAPIDLAILRRIFDNHDTNKDEKLSPEELFSALVTQSIAVRFEDLDQDESGFVDFEEFAVLSTVMGKHTHPIFEKGQRAMQATMKSGSPTVVETVEPAAVRRRAAKAWRKFVSLKAFDELSISQAFRRVDANHDGYLSSSEIKIAIKHLCPSLSTVDRELMVATADTDRDDAISYNEFKQMMRADAEAEMAFSMKRFGATDNPISASAGASTGRPVEHGTTLPRFGESMNPFYAK